MSESTVTPTRPVHEDNICQEDTECEITQDVGLRDDMATSKSDEEIDHSITETIDVTTNRCEDQHRVNVSDSDIDDEPTDIVNTEDRVQEAVAMATTIPSELSINDVDHDAEIERFIADGCGCTLQEGQSCSSRFTPTYNLHKRYSICCN